MPPTFEERARARAEWPGQRISLADEGANDDLSGTTTLQQRLAMMWPLAVRAFTLAGKPISSPPRDQWPGVVRRKP